MCVSQRLLAALPAPPSPLEQSLWCLVTAAECCAGETGCSLRHNGARLMREQLINWIWERNCNARCIKKNIYLKLGSSRILAGKAFRTTPKRTRGNWTLPDPAPKHKSIFSDRTGSVLGSALGQSGFGGPVLCSTAVCKT